MITDTAWFFRWKGSRSRGQQCSVLDFCSLFLVGPSVSLGELALTFCLSAQQPEVYVKHIFSVFHSWANVYVGVTRRAKEETELACHEVKKYSKKADCRSSVNKRQCQLRAHERARPLPASLGVYLADQFWYPESSVNLLQAIEIPQGQIELVQESSLITWRFCGRMWAQQVIWRVAKWLPVKRQASPWAHGKASWSEDMFFLLKVDGSQPVDFQGLCNKHRISQT